MKTTKFQRKPFFVDAVQVTTENIEEVAKWCNGEIKRFPGTDGEDETAYIWVKVHRAANERQKKAYAGDWVLLAGKNFKIYTDKAMKICFDNAEPQFNLPA